MGGIILTLVVIGLILNIPFIFRSIRRGKLKTAYEEALRGTDKQRALYAGRAYYASCRKGNVLTTYDEAAINNDIAAMKGA